MKPADSYGAFAWAYDQALGIPFFEKVEPLLESLLDLYGPGRGTHLDLACGTGLACEYFTSRGFVSTGVDGSWPMLAIARKRCTRLFAADLRGLSLRGNFDRITSLYDSLNHLLDADDLLSLFLKVHSLMDTDGLFWFDVNHPDIYPSVWGAAEPFVAQGDDFLLSLATRYSRVRKHAAAHVTGWAMVNGKRVEIDEHHEQRPYNRRELEKLLGKAGLKPVEIILFDPFQQGRDFGSPAKMFFVVRRK